MSAHSSHTKEVDNPNFSRTEWDLIRGLAGQGDTTTCTDAGLDTDKIVSDMEQTFADITEKALLWNGNVH